MFDNLIGVTKLDGTEKRAILNHLTRIALDLDGIVEKASEVLGGISCLLGVALAPRFQSRQSGKNRACQIDGRQAAHGAADSGGIG
jgi:transcriptional regulator of heat shock response